MDASYVVERFGMGLYCSDLAKELGCTCGAVYSFCKRKNIPIPKKPRGGQNRKDLIRQVFGSLTVVARAESKNGLATWHCECVCGGEIIVRGSDLRQGKIKTCGCRTGIENKRNWQGSKFIPKSYWRSLNQNAIQRKIKFNLCLDYLDFLFEIQQNKCALSGLPISFRNHTASLDRIENDLGYIEGNVHWVHKDVNCMKQTFAKDYFVYLCKSIAEKHYEPT